MNKSLLAIASLSAIMSLTTACDKINTALDDVPTVTNGVNSMGSKLDKTNDGLHKQTLEVSLQAMNDKKNWDELTPVPFKLMPYGQTFAQEATAAELAQFFYLTLLEIQNGNLDQGTDLTTGNSIPYVAGSQQLQDVMTEKLAKLTILSMLAGFAPDDTVNQLIQDQIHGDGSQDSQRYRDTTYAFLALRAQFIDDVLITNTVLSGSLSNIGMAEEAIRFTQQVDFVDHLRYVSQLQVKASFTLQVAPAAGQPAVATPIDFSFKTDPTRALALWKQIQNHMASDLKVDVNSVGNDPTDDAKIQADEQQRVQAAQATVNSAIANWTAPTATASMATAAK